MRHLKELLLIFSWVLLCTVHAGSRLPNVKGSFNSGKGPIATRISTGKTSISSKLSSARKFVLPFTTRLNSFYQNYLLSNTAKVQIEVDDSGDIFEQICDFIKRIMPVHYDYLATKRISIKLGNEIGLRAMKKLFTRLTMEVIYKHKLFKYSNQKYNGIEINPTRLPSTPKRVEQYDFFGRICALAIIQRQILAVPFTVPFLKTILRERITLEDLKEARPDFCDKLNGISTQNNQLTFFDGVELKKQFGNHTIQTEADKAEIVKVAVEHWYDKFVKWQMEAFMKGFNSLIPNELIESFTANELGQMLSGTPINTENVKRWKDHISADRRKVELFCKALESFNNRELAKILAYITGTPRLPIGEFKKLSLKIEEDGTFFGPLSISVPVNEWIHKLQISNGYEYEKQVSYHLKQKIQNVEIPRIVQ